MRKSIYLLLCVVSFALFSCDKEENNTPEIPTDPVVEYDPNGEADFNLYFCVTDTLAMCMDLGVVDSLHPELDCSHFVQRAIDTTKTDDKAIYKLITSKLLINTDKLVVVELPIRLKVGAYEFHLTGKRNATQLTMDTLPVAMACYTLQSDPKVKPDILAARVTAAKITKDPNNNIEKWFHVNSNLCRIAFDFKVSK